MKIKQKVMAILMIMLLIGTNLLSLGNQVIAANLLEQNNKTNHANIEFNSYFEEQTHTKNIGVTEKANLYIKIKVNNTGYLKNGIVNILDSNYQIDTTNLQNEWIQNATKNQIKLKQINSNQEIIITLPIIISASETITQNFLEKISTISFEATYIDGNGKENNINKTIQNQVIWEAEDTLNLTSNVTKYIPYQKNETYGVLLQTTINSSLTQHLLPIEQTQLTMQVPEIKETKPTKVTVIANQTTSTNGDTKGTSFNADNYTYNTETGNLTIQTTNTVKENGTITWNKNGIDEYVINFIYEGKELYETVMQNGFKNTMQVNAKITIPNTNKTTIENEITINYEEKETKGTYADITISPIPELSKAYMYANYDIKEKENKKQTLYEINYRIQINDINLAQEISMQTLPEYYIDNQKEEHKIENSYVKQIKIAKTNFEQILSQEGKIEITTIHGTTLGTIQKDTKVDENQNYVFSIEDAKVNEIILKTSKPIAEGNLEITLEKALMAEQNYTKEQVREFSKITLGVINKTEKTEKNAEISLIEPVSKAQISIEEAKQNLSTVVVNENVEITIVLDTSSIQNSLYKNPTLKIELPSYINKIDIKNANILMGEGLTIKNVKTKIENKSPIIYIELEGTQTQYTLNAEYKGARIVLNTNISVETLTPSNKNKITMTYTNENEANPDYIGTAETPINFVAPTGVVAANGIENYADNAKAIMSISAQSENATIETYTEKKIATVTGKVVNNYANKITNVVILGRLPSENNIIIDSQQQLGSTFNAKLSGNIKVSEIDTKNYKVYYSNKVDATTDLTNKNNNWTTTPTSNAKSYMIVTNNYEMQAGEYLNFEYNIEIPANLTYNNSSYEMYKVYYDNVSSVGTMPEAKTSAILGVTTGQGPELEVSVAPMVNVAVREGQIIRMVATIKNIGGLKAENVKLKITAPEGTVHTEIIEGTLEYTESNNKEKIISIGNIEPQQTITKDYELKIQKGTTITTQSSENEENHIIEEFKYPGDKDIQNIISITADNVDNQIKSEPYTFKVLEGDLSIVNIPTVNESEVLKTGKNITYKIKVENISNDKNLNNVTLKTTLPQGIKINDIYYSDSNKLTEKNRENININGNDISVNLGKLDSLYAYMKQNNENNNTSPQLVKMRTTAYVYVDCTIQTFTGELKTVFTASADNIDEHYSNIRKNYAETVQLKLVQNDLNKQYIKERSEYTYNFVAENIGNISSIENKIEMVIPEGLSFVKAEYNYQGKKITKTAAEDGVVSISIYELKPGEKLNIAITVKANLLPDKNDKEINTTATLEASGFEKTTSNTIKVVIEYDSEAHQTLQSGGQANSSTSTSKKSYKITGTAWIDENKNGKRDTQEKTLANIPVILINKENNTIVKDQNTNAEKRTTTSNDGSYQFENLAVGEYLVLFLYDAGQYSLTTYKLEGVAETLNSDAIDIDVVIDGKKQIAGITDIIKITNSNVRDIDIGLYIAEKFDLRIDKYITKITRTTPTSGTDVLNYNNSKLTKIEVLGKNVNQSNIIVEYKIAIKNEGQVAGYARKIVDYLPEDAAFSTEINKDWYLSDNNQNVYNTSLAETIIQPGETKEITLILSFNITDKNIGNPINNNAEIYESYNEKGLQDIDSVNGNKVSDEDDISNADIVLSVVTGGQIVIYSTFILAIIILISFGILVIRTRVLLKKKF